MPELWVAWSLVKPSCQSWHVQPALHLVHRLVHTTQRIVENPVPQKGAGVPFDGRKHSGRRMGLLLPQDTFLVHVKHFESHLGHDLLWPVFAIHISCVTCVPHP